MSIRLRSLRGPFCNEETLIEQAVELRLESTPLRGIGVPEFRKYLHTLLVSETWTQVATVSDSLSARDAIEILESTWREIDKEEALANAPPSPAPAIESDEEEAPEDAPPSPAPAIEFDRVTSYSRA